MLYIKRMNESSTTTKTDYYCVYEVIYSTIQHIAASARQISKHLNDEKKVERSTYSVLRAALSIDNTIRKSNKEFYLCTIRGGKTEYNNNKYNNSLTKYVEKIMYCVSVCG